MVSKPQRHGHDLLTPKPKWSDFDPGSSHVISLSLSDIVQEETNAVDTSTSLSKKMQASYVICSGLHGPWHRCPGISRGGTKASAIMQQHSYTPPSIPGSLGRSLDRNTQRFRGEPCRLCRE